MNFIHSQQQSRNQESADAWDLYAPHRRRVTSLLIDALDHAASDTPRVCLLGAGNCNDVDLGELIRRNAEILLVDLDAQALERAAARQQLAGHPGIQLLPDTDVTGLCEQLAPTTQNDPVGTDAGPGIPELTLAADASCLPGLPGDFDVTASVCLLSQLIDAVLRRFPDPHAALPLLQAVRRRHLRLLLEQCRPGGHAILFSEVVSSNTCPELEQVPESALPELLAQQLAAKNFFTGLHPGAILQELRSVPALQALVGDIRPIPPWKWPFLYRTYAVTAFVIQRAG